MEAILVAIIAAAPSSVAAIASIITNKKVKKIDELRLDECKTYLIDFLSDIENGIPKTEIQKKVAHEKYDFYTSHGGNSYVHEHWDINVKKELI